MKTKPSKLKRIIGRGILAGAIGLAGLTAGCANNTRQNPREAYIEYSERDSTSMERTENGFDVNILDFDGIAKIEFYRNDELLSASTSLDELVKTGVWGGEGVVDGEVIWKSSDLPLGKQFTDYHLTNLYGRNVYRDLADEDNISLRVYDKEGNVRVLRVN